MYVCTSRRLHRPSRKFTEFQDWSNPEIQGPIADKAFNFCDISQNNGHSGQLHYDNLLWYRSKVMEYGPRPINHVKCYYFHWPIGVDFQERTAATEEEAGAKFWRAVFGGAASIRFHRRTSFAPTDLREGFGLEPDALPHLKSMRMFADAVRVFSLEPHNELLSQRSENEAYCLAEPGKQYAVFFTGESDRSVEIDLSPAGESLNLRWLNIADCRWETETTMLSDSRFLLSAPQGGHWVAILTASDTPTGTVLQ